MQRQNLVSTLKLYTSVHSLYNEEPWAQRLVQAAMFARLEVPATLAPPFEAAEITGSVRDAFKATQLYLSFVRGGAPQWFMDWKRRGIAMTNEGCVADMCATLTSSRGG